MPGLYPTAYRATFPAFFYAFGSSLFLLSVCFLFMFSILSRRCPLLATSCPSFFCLLSMLISDCRFDLVWFRLSCDHGWIRSGSVNVRKQQHNNIYGSMCVSTYLRIYVYMYECICVSMYLCIFVSMYLCIYVSMYLCIYVSMHLCIYVYFYLSGRTGLKHTRNLSSMHICCT